MFKYIQKKQSLGLLIGFLLMWYAVVAVSAGFAFEGKAGIEPIGPPPSFNTDASDTSNMAAKYFDFIGPLVYKFHDRIVIGDRNFYLGPDAETSNVEEGDYIGIKFNESGEVERIEKLQPPQKRGRGD